MLSERQREMYGRQIILPELGEAGQEKLAAASVLLLGAGGLGSPCAFYLTALGIGRLGVVDGDTVSLSNLNRQILYTPDDLGKSKALAARERLIKQNPELKVDAYPEFLTRENAEQIIAGYDLVMDCLDNFPARFIMNDACLSLGIPFVHAGVYHLFGQTMTVIPGQTACLRCLLPDREAPPSDPAMKGIIGATAGVLACLQVTEAYKYLAGLPLNSNGFVMYNGRELSLQQLKIEPNPRCLCQQRRCG